LKGVVKEMKLKVNKTRTVLIVVLLLCTVCVAKGEEKKLGVTLDARKVEKDGTGLGLSIAKEIIQRHGGNIWVDSREGFGTKFSFTLPKSNLSKNVS